MSIYKTILRNIDDPTWKNPLGFDRIGRMAHLVGTLTMIDIYLRDEITVQTTLDIPSQLYFYGKPNECSWTELARDTEKDLTTLLGDTDLHPLNADMAKKTIGICRNFLEVHEGKREIVSSAESSPKKRGYAIFYLS